MSKRKYQPALSMEEVENRVTDDVVKTAKEDACLDWFISRLSLIKPDYSPNRWGMHWSWTPDFKDFPEQDLKLTAEELQQNLERLIPGYCKADTPLLEDEEFKKKLGRRWCDTVRRYPEEDTGPDLDWVPQSLLDVLLNKQSLDQAEAGPSASQGDTQSAFIESCRQLKGFIDGEQATATFACSGTIPIAESQPQETLLSAPVSVFWSTGNDSTAHKLVLPINRTVQESSAGVLQQLVADCDPASFGLGDKDVIDPEYRRAVKLNPDQFASSFHPANHGIIENIEQILLPSLNSEHENKLQSRKIHAELYKFNAYSGPSGLFRKHVDTPRSENQVGSLVVCLPAPFKGGKLTVQHHGQVVEFDWSVKSASAIQWAAFYSDCEHEIETITEGDRITLTYNLYVTEPHAGSILETPLLDPKALPLYTWIKDLLAGPGFMQRGGVLGICCSHAYPQASQLTRLQLPRTLKGADLVLYSVFRSLGIEVAILPVLEVDGDYGTENPSLGIGGSEKKEIFYGDLALEELQGFLETGEYYGIRNKELMPQSSNADANIDRRCKLLMLTRQVHGMKQLREFAQENDLPIKQNSLYDTVGARVGSRLRPYKATSRGQEEELDDVIQDVWPAYYLPGITWITEPKHTEMAFSYIAYGNQAEMGTRYSCVSMFAVIPPSDRRDLLP